MCGVAGYIALNGKADPEILSKMVSSLAHRGPDEMAGFVNGKVGLGHARLSIVDLEGGHQPAFTADRQVVLAFNGEIFNYMLLRSNMQEKGDSFTTKSEVETLLHLYLRHGEQMFEMLEGQFAIVIWDARRQRLILGRDRFGIRPLFWHRDAAAFSFASEIKALAQRPGVSLKLDNHSLIQTFRFWTNVGKTTAFEGVNMIPPGHVLIFEGGSTHLRRFWEWPLQGTVDPLELPSDEAYFERFSDEMNAAIQRQCMSDVTVASYLSGGVDSSVTAALLSRQMTAVGGTLKTYSVTFDDPEYDEFKAQQAMVEHFDLDHTSLNICSEDIGTYFPQVVWHTEAPLFRTAPVPLFLLARQVHKDGIKVVMTGEGADEVLLGYDLFKETLIRRFWARSPDSKWRGKLFGRLYHYLPQFRNPRFVNLLTQSYKPFLSLEDERFYAMAHRWSNGKSLEVYFSEEMRSASSQYDPISDLEPWLPSQYMQSDDIARAQSVEVNTLLSNYLLSSQGDRMSLAHSVEGRYPYLDDQFVDFAARLPRRMKLRGLKDKFILRNSFKNLIPHAISSRPKVAYQAPDIKGFLVNGKLPDYVEELLSPERIEKVGLFSPAAVMQLVEKGRHSNHARMGTRDNMAFVLILSTMLLDQMFVSNADSVSLFPLRRNSDTFHEMKLI